MNVPDTILLITQRELDTVRDGDYVEIESHHTFPIVVLAFYRESDSRPRGFTGLQPHGVPAALSDADILALQSGQKVRAQTTGDADPLTIDLFLGGIR